MLYFFFNFENNLFIIFILMYIKIFINQIQGDKIVYSYGSKNSNLGKIITYISSLFKVNEVKLSSNLILQVNITIRLILNKFFILGFLFYFF